MSDNAEYDWSEFNVHVYCKIPPQDAFLRWATCEGLESFFIREAELTSTDQVKRGGSATASSGDSYLWSWIHDFELPGKVLDVNPGKSVTYTFGSMKFTVEIHESSEGSLVKLWQYDIPIESELDKANNHLNCRSCWVFFLTNLKSVVETGVDLRVHDPIRSDYPAVHFKPPELQ